MNQSVLGSVDADRLIRVSLTRFWDRPDDMIGGLVPEWFVFTKTPRLAIVVSRIVAYPNGFTISLTILPRPGCQLPDSRPQPEVGDSASDGFGSGLNMTLRPAGSDGLEGSVKDRGFVFSVRFSDGSTGTAAETERLLRFWSETVGSIAALEVPPEPFVRSQGYGISPTRHQFDYWVAPLPPPGPLILAIDWTAATLEHEEFTLDANVVLAAAARASRIWDA